MSFGVWLVLLLALVGCGASSVYMGANKWAITCERRKSDCYEEAARVCVTGFEVVNSETEQGVNAAATNGVAYATTTSEHDMIVECREQ